MKRRGYLLVRRFSSRAFLAILALRALDASWDRSKSCFRKSWCREYREPGDGEVMWAEYWVEF